MPSSLPSSRSAPSSSYWMYGMHAVAAALVNPERAATRLLVTQQALVTLAALVENISIPRQRAVARERLGRASVVAKPALDKLHPPQTTHQSVSLLCRPLAQPSVKELTASLAEKAEATLVMLDRVQDSRNIGAILRSASFFGVNAVIAAKGHAPREGAALAKAACGALETVPLLHANLAQTLARLEGWGKIAFEAQGQASSRKDSVLSADRVVFVFGAEGSGLRRLVRERCDVVTGIRGGNRVTESLNVSSAVAVALAERGWREG